MILKDKKYFSYLKMRKAGVSIISGKTNIIEGSGRANLLLAGGTRLCITDALYSSKSYRNLLSIRRNGYHLETTNEDDIEYIFITNMASGEKCILERLPEFSSGLYYTYINMIETHAISNPKFANHDEFFIWHDRWVIQDQS
ncbi:unnamed protein product [Linum tenue]|uniref:Uncharacterized protein n=1 Tax=Linum tenue TaxID=586396 RepID=A0AAV0QZ24_9ROSI|nr:unnamed protein product [Linum tenue]